MWTLYGPDRSSILPQLLQLLLQSVYGIWNQARAGVILILLRILSIIRFSFLERKSTSTWIVRILPWTSLCLTSQESHQLRWRRAGLSVALGVQYLFGRRIRISKSAMNALTISKMCMDTCLYYTHSTGLTLCYLRQEFQQTSKSVSSLYRFYKYLQGVPIGHRPGLGSLDFDYFPVCQTLPWLMVIWQMWLGSWARWRNSQVKVNPTKVYNQLGHPLYNFTCTWIFIDNKDY